MTFYFVFITHLLLYKAQYSLRSLCTFLTHTLTLIRSVIIMFGVLLCIQVLFNSQRNERVSVARARNELANIVCVKEERHVLGVSLIR